MIQKQLRRRKKEALFLLLIIIVAYLVGILMMIIISKKSAEKEVFLVGTVLAMIIGAGLQFFSNILTFLQEFNIAISMGQTRKSFVWCYELVSFLELFAITVILRGLAEIEQLIYNIVMPDGKFLIRADVLVQLKIIVPIILGMTAVQMLLQALLLRFGMKAFWVIWIGWMLLCFSPSALRQNEVLSEKAANLAAALFTVVSHLGAVYWIMAGVILAGIMVGTAWGFLRRQQVTI